MKLYLHGHDYKYAAEQMLLTLFPAQRPEYPAGPPAPGEDALVLSLHRGTVWATATAALSCGGREYRAARRCRTAELTDPLSTDRALQRILKLAFYDAGTAARGGEPPWGALTGVRPVKIPTKALLRGESEAEAERRLREKAEREAKRYLKQLTPQAQAARETLEQAQQLLEEYPEQTAKLSTAAKAKRVNDRSNPAYRWVALAIIVAGIAAVVYGILALIRGENVGVYFALFGLAAIFFFSGAHVLPTAKNNKKAIAQEWERSISDVAALLPEDFPVPARYAHPVVLQRMIRVLREGRAQSVGEALNVMKKDLKALNASVQVEQEEYDEVVAIKPMFLLWDYE